MSVIFARERAKIINRQQAGLAFLDAPFESLGIPGLAGAGQARGSIQVPTCDFNPLRTTFFHDPVAGLDTRSTQRTSKKKSEGEIRDDKSNNSDKATARGFTIFKNIIVQHESELEQTTSLCMQARPDVALIYSQYPKLKWVEPAGKSRTHTADFFLRYSSGRNVAFLVKVERKREEMEALIKRIKAYGLGGVVDDVILITEQYATRERAENARAVLWSRYFHDEHEVEVLLSVLSGMGPWVRFGDLMRDCPVRRVRRVAIWRLIERGILASSTGEKITELTWLRSTHNRQLTQH